jgi:hypothetical protein
MNKIFSYITKRNKIQYIVDTYFTAFNNKDIDILTNLYADNVILSEWDANIFVGKAKVLEANRNLFSIAPNLQITVISSGITNNISINEIVVVVNDDMVKVVDSITIVNNKISKIMAYRGF